MQKQRKIFFTVASGGHETEKHYYDTIKTKRNIDEAVGFSCIRVNNVRGTIIKNTRGRIIIGFTLKRAGIDYG